MAKKKIWHLVTNHQNMLYMLAADMLTGKAGFRDKYYTDPLGVYPGWIPLFKDDEFPVDVFEYSTSERKHLVPCIASINSSDLSGPYQLLASDGERRVVTSLRLRKTDIAVLVRAPLPSSLLQGISFRTEEEKQVFETAAGDVANVDLSSREIKIDEKLFSIDSKIAWPVERKQEQEQLLDDSSANEVSDKFPAFGQALGGAIAMLYHGASRSESGLAAFRMATSSSIDTDSERFANDKILTELPQWVSGGKISSQVDFSAKIYWGVIASLIASQSESRPQPPVDVVLTYLSSELNQLSDKKLKQGLEALIADMRNMNGLGGGTITELLERYKGGLSRSLLLLCLREHCIDLLEFSHSQLRDVDYVLAGILFGVRDTWLQMPHALRQPDLTAYVAYRMAYVQHQKQGDKLSLKAPILPKPLRQLFPAEDEDWSPKQIKIAEELAGNCNWNDCVQTHITLEEGDWPEQFERDGLKLVLPGKATAATPQLDKAKFLHHLGQWPPIDRTIELDVRKKLLSKTRGKVLSKVPS